MTKPKKSFPATVSGRLRYARESRGFSARALSKAAGLNPGHVTVLEGRENARIWPETITALAKALDVDAAWIMFGKGTPPPAPTFPNGKRPR